jgi:hypothetical protein
VCVCVCACVKREREREREREKEREKEKAKRKRKRKIEREGGGGKRTEGEKGQKSESSGRRIDFWPVSVRPLFRTEFAAVLSRLLRELRSAATVKRGIGRAMLIAIMSGESFTCAAFFITRQQSEDRFLACFCPKGVSDGICSSFIEIAS